MGRRRLLVAWLIVFRDATALVRNVGRVGFEGMRLCHRSFQLGRVVNRPMLLKDVGSWFLHPDFQVWYRVIAGFLRLARHEGSVPLTATPMPAIGYSSLVLATHSSQHRWVLTPRANRGVGDD